MAAGLTIAVAAGTFGVVGTAVASALVAAPDPSVAPAVTLSPLGTYATGQLDESAAEIVAFHAASKRLFVVNAQSGKVDVLDAQDPAAPTRLFELAVGGTASADGSVVSADAVVNSVAIRPDGLAVAAVEAAPRPTTAGSSSSTPRRPRAPRRRDPRRGPRRRAAGHGDLLPDGTRIAVANEGEPADDYSVDPEGPSRSSLLPWAWRTQPRATSAPRRSTRSRRAGQRRCPRGPRVRRSLRRGDRHARAPRLGEPRARVHRMGRDGHGGLRERPGGERPGRRRRGERDRDRAAALGTQDHLAPGKGIDASDKDGKIDIRAWPVKGLYQPDTIASYQAGGATYLVTANEGDSRDWSGYSEVKRVKDLGKKGVPGLCADAFSGFVGAAGNPRRSPTSRRTPTSVASTSAPRAGCVRTARATRSSTRTGRARSPSGRPTVARSSTRATRSSSSSRRSTLSSSTRTTRSPASTAAATTRDPSPRA
ncbi:hypothetical protein NKG05_02125 [Oerskovia sp. M15]